MIFFIHKPDELIVLLDIGIMTFTVTSFKQKTDYLLIPCIQYPVSSIQYHFQSSDANHSSYYIEFKQNNLPKPQ